MTERISKPLSYIGSILDGPTGGESAEILFIERLGEAPVWVNDAARFQRVKLLSGYEFLLVEPRSEMAADRLLMMYQLVQRASQIPIILVTDQQPPQVRSALMRARVGLVRSGKMLFAPQFGVHFQSSPQFDRAINKTSHPIRDSNSLLLPREQILLGAVILNPILRRISSLTRFAEEFAKMLTNVRTVPFTTSKVMGTLSQALNQFQERKFVKLERDGKELHIEFADRNLLWSNLCRNAQPLIAQTVPIFSETDLLEQNPQSALSALSKFSDLLPPKLPTFAMNRMHWLAWSKEHSPVLKGDVPKMFVEIWRLNPWFLAHQNTVNPLLLALTCRRDRDERVRIAVTEMLQQFELKSEPLWTM
jgi:hypothetical protein